jgi:N-acyl-D-amino-acid deacylase
VATAPQQPAELLLRNATIVDGSGAPAFAGEVGITGGRIVAVGAPGSVQTAPGAAVHDLDGLVLSPGFIDIHNHSDGAILRRPLAEVLLAQGLTTIVVGADGGSRWPIGAYLDEVDAARPALNVATTVGHGTVRLRVLGADQAREATSDEIGAMKDLVRQAMDEGAFGLSSGLEYDPGRFAATEELIALAGAAGERGGFYISHMRDEELYVMEAVDEVIRIGREAGLPVQISHIKMGDATAWGRSGETLDRMRGARAEGIDITADWYPYAASATTLALVVPSRNFEDAAQVEAGLEVRGGADRVQVTRYEPDASIEGLRLDEIAARWQTNPVDAYQRIMRNGGGSMISHSMQLADVNAFAADPLVMVCSDGGIGSAHPRGAGTFPRVLAHYVRELGILDLETAVHKMTMMPADRLGLADRGRIAVGAVADLVAFDPATVQDNSTFEQPELPASGIARVWVNGELVWDGGAPTGARPGAALRHSGGGRQ